MNRDSRWPGDEGALEVSAARDRGRSGEQTAWIHTTNNTLCFQTPNKASLVRVRYVNMAVM